MAKQDVSINPRILESAKQEFLKHGFENASLKKICENANVTTGALYKRYSGKDDLFHAVVEPTLHDLNQVAEMKRVRHLSKVSDEQLIKAWDMDYDYMLWWFQYLYERQDGFVLLLRCSQGSKDSHFAHEWVETMTQATYEYFLEAKKRGLTSANIESAELHILLSAFWTTIYEPFIHDFTWEEIENHSRIVCHLFNWYKVLGFE